jgi:hypothetical protein
MAHRGRFADNSRSSVAAGVVADQKRPAAFLTRHSVAAICGRAGNFSPSICRWSIGTLAGVRQFTACLVPRPADDTFER